MDLNILDVFQPSAFINLTGTHSDCSIFGQCVDMIAKASAGP